MVYFDQALHTYVSTWSNHWRTYQPFLMEALLSISPLSENAYNSGTTWYI